MCRKAGKFEQFCKIHQPEQSDCTYVFFFLNSFTTWNERLFSHRGACVWRIFYYFLLAYWRSVHRFIESGWRRNFAYDDASASLAMIPVWICIEHALSVQYMYHWKHTGVAFMFFFSLRISIRLRGLWRFSRPRYFQRTKKVIGEKK